jgi:RHS repeat-associated protein
MDANAPTLTIGVPAVKLAYNYDAVGNLVSVTDAINGTTAGTNAYSYDVLNRVTRLTQSGTGVASKRVDMSYDAVNRLTGLQRYGDIAGTLGVADSSWGYDAAGRLTSLAHQRGATTIASYGFAYDVANRITQQSGTDGTQDYSYDDTNQLTAVDHSAIPDEAYSYDANGNRTNAGYGTGTDNQLLTDGVYNYQYDDEGNRTKRTEIATGKVTEYVWDYRNRLTGVTFKDAAGVVTKTIEYAYDSSDRRISKKIDGIVAERYVYDGANIALVFDGAGVQTHRYLYGAGVDQILADERGGSVVLALSGAEVWALADNLGTVRDVVDGGGVVLNHVSYDSYGRVVSQTNPAFVFRFGYTGREQDNETGLDYYRARYYDSAVGRFISEDPIGFTAGDANLYRYVGNSPVNAIDPSGNNLILLTLISLIAGEAFGPENVQAPCRPGDIHDTPLDRQFEGAAASFVAGGYASKLPGVVVKLEQFGATQLPRLSNLLDRLGRNFKPPGFGGSPVLVDGVLPSGSNLYPSVNRGLTQGGTQGINAGAGGLAPQVLQSNSQPWRGNTTISDGDSKKGWEHIESRHILGNDPKGDGDLFPPGTTRQQLEDLAQKVINKGTRTSDPSKRMQTFEYRDKFNGQRDRIKVYVDSYTGEVITIYPVRSE